MEKRNFQNRLSKEKTFKSNVKKCKQIIKDWVESESTKVLQSDPLKTEPELIEIDIVRSSSPFLEYSSNSEENGDSNDKCKEIKSWAVRNKISQTALEDLLHTIKRVGVEDLPLSAKTLLGTHKYLNDYSVHRNVNEPTSSLAESLRKNNMNNEDVLGMLKNILKYQKDFNTRIEKIEQKQTSTLASQSILQSGQDVILENLQQLSDMLENIQANIVSNPEIMAHSKIAIQKVENIVRRLNTVKHDKSSDEIASMLPLRTLAAVQNIEQELGTPDFAQELATYLRLMKGTSEDVSSVIREIFTDDVLQNYNWDGRWGKKALGKLVLFNKTLRDVFQQQDAYEFEKSVKKAVERSHHRVKQKQYVKNRNN